VRKCGECLLPRTSTRKKCQVMASRMVSAFGASCYCFDIVECAESSLVFLISAQKGRIAAQQPQVLISQAG